MSVLGSSMVFLAAAVVAVPVFKKLKLGAILGYLAAGVVIGPSVFDWVNDPETILHFAELGVVLLLFLIGLELEPDKLWKMRTQILFTGGGQLLISSAIIGFAVYFFNYSTWQGRNGLYLEDLYVSPKSRGLGAGKALLQHLAKTAVENDCGRFEWSVLDWNKPAIDFYESLGAKPKSEWLGYRMDGQTLIDFAKQGE